MDKVWVWLADSPLATAVRFAIGAAISYALANPDWLALPPVVAVMFGAAAPVLLRWVNPADAAYGSFGADDAE
jgi:hypothetical protein